MKKYFILILLMLSFNVTNAETIKSVGKIALDMSFNEIKTLFPNQLTKQKTSNEIKKVYKISSYVPVKDCTVKDIYLYFYSDTLYAIYINDADQVGEAFKIKYGKPAEHNYRFRTQVEEVTAIYKSDAVDFIDYSHTYFDYLDTFYEWNNDNPFIETRLITRCWTDDNDKLYLKEVLLIKNNAYAKCVELETEKHEYDMKNERLKELEGL